MPRPRFEHLDPSRQEALLEAAMRELADQGPEQASLNKILAEVGLSKGVAYYYFDDREDLFVTVLSRAIDRAVQAIGGVGPVDSAEDFWREFHGLSQRVLVFLREHPVVAKLAKRLASSDAALRTPRVRARYNAFHLWFSEFLRKGQKVGAVRSDLPLDMLVALAGGWGEAMDRWTLAHWDEVNRTEASLAAHTEATIDLFRRAFGPGAGGHSPKTSTRLASSDKRSASGRGKR